MARSQPHRGRRDGKAAKESKVQKKAQDKKSCQLISSAQERGLSTAPGLTQPRASAVWGRRTTVSAAGIFLIPLQIGSGSWVSKKLLDFFKYFFSNLVISVLYPLIFWFALWTVSPSDKLCVGAKRVPGWNCVCSSSDLD